MKTKKLIVAVFFCFFVASSALARVSNLSVEYYASYSEDSDTPSSYPVMGISADTSSYNDVNAVVTAPDGTVGRLLAKPDGGAVSLSGGALFDVRKPDVYFRGSLKVPGKYKVSICQDGSCATKAIMAYSVIVDNWSAETYYIDRFDKAKGALATLDANVFFGYSLPDTVTVRLQIEKETYYVSGAVSVKPKGGSSTHEIDFQLTSADLEGIFGTITTDSHAVSATVTILDGVKVITRETGVRFIRPYPYN